MNCKAETENSFSQQWSLEKIHVLQYCLWWLIINNHVSFRLYCGAKYEAEMYP